MIYKELNLEVLMNKKQKRIILIYLVIMLLSIIFPPSGGFYRANTIDYTSELLSKHNINHLGMVRLKIYYEPIWHGIDYINYSALLMQDIVFLMIFIGFFLLYMSDDQLTKNKKIDELSSK